MKNSRILLLALTAGILTSCAFGATYSGTLNGGKEGMPDIDFDNFYTGTVDKKTRW